MNNPGGSLVAGSDQLTVKFFAPGGVQFTIGCDKFSVHGVVYLVESADFSGSWVNFSLSLAMGVLI